MKKTKMLLLGIMVAVALVFAAFMPNNVGTAEPIDPPTVHNSSLDTRFKTFFGGENAPAQVDSNLAETYNMYGTYMATVILQHQVDYNMFLAFLNGDSWILRQFPDNKANHKAAVSGDNAFMRSKKAPIVTWLDSNYNNFYTPVFGTFDHKPMAEELMAALDSYVQRNEFNSFRGDFTTEYQGPAETFAQKLAKCKLGDEEKASSLVAYRVYLADMMLFHQLISSLGVNINSKANEKLAQTFRGYMLTVEPKAE